MTTKDRLYATRICGSGRAVRWGECLPQILEQLRTDDLRHPRDAYRYAAAKLFAEVNGWSLLIRRPIWLNEVWQPEEVLDVYQQPDGRPAAVIHTHRPIRREDVTEATLDELAGSWYDPEMRAYVIRDRAP